MDRLFKVNMINGDFIIDIDFLVGLRRVKEGTVIKCYAYIHDYGHIEMSEGQYYNLLDMCNEKLKIEEGYNE